MEVFTIEKLKRNPNAVLDEVRNGPVEITHRDRPTMILVKKEDFRTKSKRKTS